MLLGSVDTRVTHRQHMGDHVLLGSVDTRATQRQRMGDHVLLGSVGHRHMRDNVALGSVDTPPTHIVNTWEITWYWDFNNRLTSRVYFN